MEEVRNTEQKPEITAGQETSEQLSRYLFGLDALYSQNRMKRIGYLTAKRESI